jgi:hypothetical protein
MHARRVLVFLMVGALGGTMLSVAARPAAAATPTVSIGSGAVVEGDITRRYIKFTISLSEPSASTITVPFSTSDVSATAGPDYKAKSGTLVFNAGAIVKYTAVTVWTDIQVESDETFAITLGTPTNANLGNAVGTGTILDDDLGGGGKVSIGDSGVYETCVGNKLPRAIVAVTLAAIQGGPVVVQVTTASGSAMAGSDFTSTSKTFTITSGQINKEFKVPILVDGVVEGSETFSVNLALVSGSVIVGRAVGTVTINDCV